MRCRCVDCFIKFCATQTIFQRRRYAEQTGYKSTGTMTSARRSSPPCYPIPDFLSFSRPLVARGHAANPRVVYLRKCILTWPAGDYNRAQSYRYGDHFARINSRVVHRNRWTFVSSICFFLHELRFREGKLFTGYYLGWIRWCDFSSSSILESLHAE